MAYFSAKRRRFYVFLWITIEGLGGITPLKAQDILGKVIDSQYAPIEFANVLILNPVDSTLVKGNVSSEQGEFYFANVLRGKNVLQISYLGYTTKQIEITVNENEIVNIGDILLDEDVNLLNEVVVTAFSSPFSRKGNDLIANVSTSLLSSIGTVSDIIKRFPGISIKENVITVFGKGSPIIYVNNRKLYDESELQQLQSSEISTIELINNPGAKYDAEGRSVLIIKTKSNEENGVAIQVFEKASQSNYFNHQETIGLTYTHNSFSLFSSFSHASLKNSRGLYAEYIVHADTLWKQSFDIPQLYNDKTNRITIGVDWSVSSEHAVGAQYIGTFSSNKVTSSGIEDVWANEIDYDKIATVLDSKEKPYQHLVNMFYKGRYGQTFDWQLDLDYMKSHGKTNQQITETSSIENRDVMLQSQSDFELYAAKLTMEQQLNESGNLEFGGEYSRVNGSGFIFNPEQYVQNNIYTNEEEKVAGFITYNKQLSRWKLQAGMRYEYVSTRSTEDRTKQAITDRSTYVFYPDVSFSGGVGNTQMGLSMSRKTTRPPFSMLNSNNYYLNRFLIQKGNPHLRNEDIYQMDYHLAYKSLGFTAGYIYKKDPIAFNLKSVESNPSQTIMTYANYPYYQEINALLSYRFEHKIIRSQLSTALRKPFFSVDYLGKNSRRNRMSFNLEFHNDIVLPEEFILSINYDYHSKRHFYLEENKGYHYTDIGIRRSFLNNRLLVNLQGTDVFQWIKEQTVVEVNNISYIQRAKEETRYIVLTINYRFNNYNKKYRGNNAANDEIERM